MIEYDIFISHASEDKVTVALPLAKRLQNRGYSVWLDRFELTVGDSLREQIDHGLANSRFGVVILSSDFFAKEWPKKELNALHARVTEGVKVILPIWHRLERRDIAKFSPLLADVLAANTADGLDVVVDSLTKAIDRTRLDRQVASEETHRPRWRRVARRTTATRLSLKRSFLRIRRKYSLGVGAILSSVFVLVMMPALLLISSGRASQKEVVRGVLDSLYQRLESRDEPKSNSEWEEYFSDRLSAAYVRDLKKPVGIPWAEGGRILDFDAFFYGESFDSSVIRRDRWLIGDPVIQGNSANVLLYLASGEGMSHKMSYIFEKSHRGWRIADIVYTKDGLRLMNLLESQAPGYNQAELASLADSIKYAVLQVEFSEEDSYWFGWTGFVTLYKLLERDVSYADFLQVFGGPAFTSGPHVADSLDLDDEDSFGSYDRAFVVWVRRLVIEILGDGDFVRSSQGKYEDLCKTVCREYLLTRVRMKGANMAAATLLRRMQKGLGEDSPWGSMSYELSESGLGKDLLYGELENSFHGRSSLYFWLRREGDGTADIMEDILTIVVDKYDGTFLNEVIDQYSSG
ncbi:MAG: toll/interleukin-1 receptor domain-containing protein [Verrucomicrobiota bacterium]